MTYQVILTKPPTPDTFRPDYFPRKFRYLDDARRLVREIAAKGGEATIIQDASTRKQA